MADCCSEVPTLPIDITKSTLQHIQSQKVRSKPRGNDNDNVISSPLSFRYGVLALSNQRQSMLSINRRSCTKGICFSKSTSEVTNATYCHNHLDLAIFVNFNNNDEHRSITFKSSVLLSTISNGIVIICSYYQDDGIIIILLFSPQRSNAAPASSLRQHNTCLHHSTTSSSHHHHHKKYTTILPKNQYQN